MFMYGKEASNRKQEIDVPVAGDFPATERGMAWHPFLHGDAGPFFPESPSYPARLLRFRLRLCPPFCQVLPPVPQESGALLPAGLRPVSRFPAATRHGYGLSPPSPP